MCGELQLSQEVDSHVEFYSKHKKVVEENDKVFMRRHEEDLNMAPLFVSLSSGTTGIFLTENTQIQILLHLFRLCHPMPYPAAQSVGYVCFS